MVIKMDWFRTHLLDIITLLTIIIITYSGYKKGVIRMILSLFGIIAAAAVAGFVSSSTYEYLYFHIMQPKVIEYIQAQSDEISEEYSPEKLLERYEIYTDENSEKNLTGNEISGKLNSIFKDYCSRLTKSLSGVLPEEILESAEKYLNKNSTEDVINRSDELSIVQIIEAEIVRPVMLKTVKNAIFAIVFVVVCILISILSALVGVIRHIELVKAPDSFFGGILGFVCSLAAVAAFSLLCSIFINISSDSNPLVNSAVIEKTYIFKYVYSWSIPLIAALCSAV